MASITFLGGVGTVTGSKFLVQHGSSSVLVECGLFQGPKALRKQNWSELALYPPSLDAVIATHAHIDHIGYVPRLVKAGFDGPVHATLDTVALARIVLPDSGHIHEEDAERANRRGYSKHRPALPLYTEEDARIAVGQLRGHVFGEPFDAAPGIRCTFRRAGHILGSASVHLEFDDGHAVVISGDLGPEEHPLLLPPEPIPECDVVLCESTYGDRRRPDADLGQALGEVVDDTLSQGGVVVIPAFAVDRTEVLLWHLAELQRTGAMPEIPVYLDSPMAIEALNVYREAADRPAPDIRPRVAENDLFGSLQIIETRTVDESKALNDATGPMIIVSASGMATGGRVLHHLKRRLGSPRNSIVLVGFQAPGTRGRSLVDGARGVKFFGTYHPVRARVQAVGLSAHADQQDLLRWLATGDPDSRTTFMVHGEVEASQALARAASDAGHFPVVPRMGERVLI